MVDTEVVVTDEIGFAQKMIDTAILGNYYAIIPSSIEIGRQLWKLANLMCLVGVDF